MGKRRGGTSGIDETKEKIGGLGKIRKLTSEKRKFVEGEGREIYEK